MFQTSVDIANRALQHCGRDRVLNLSDAVDGAREVAFVYDKVRRAELRRNIWRFATRRAVLRPRDTSTYFLNPQPWSSTQIYVIGSIAGQNGLLYISSIQGNKGLSPDANPQAWSLYFGPLVANLWEDPNQGSPAGYWAGEVVYTPQNRNYVVYVSLTSGNTDTPGIYPVWLTNTLYNAGDTVLYTVSLIADPGAIPVFSDPGGGLPLIPLISQVAFQSLTDLNIGNNPATSPTNWTPIPVVNQPDGRIGQNWLQLDSTLSAIYQPYPLTCGPLSQANTRNSFYLPGGFLREAPNDPKAGTAVYLGAPGGLPLTDFNWEGNWIISQTAAPIMLRFIADIADVTMMDDMFCEGLAARIAKEVAPILCRDRADRSLRLSKVERAYKEIMDEARTVNSIEIGYIDPPLDDWISCRF